MKEPMPTKPSSFASFAVPNFRRFVLGQSVSLVGSWTETVAQALLVLHLTQSPLLLGFATAARYLPVLVLTPYAGLIVDRHDKRKVLLFTAISLAVLSIVMGTLVITETVQIWWVFVIALGFGCLTALDNPARQAFIPEIVGPELIRNAVTLNSTFVNMGRAIGPIVAAVLVSTVGIAWCFYLNAASFVAVIIALATIDTGALHPAEIVHKAKGQLREGIRYVLGVPTIIGPVAMMALIGTLTYEFEVSLPLFATSSLHGSQTTYSWLIGAFGVGSVVGGLWNTRRPRTGMRRLIVTAIIYAAAMTATGFASSVWVAVPLLIVVGMASITFLTSGNSTIQLAAPPQYRGRVTALWSTAFLGSTPVGASIIGAVGNIDAAATLFTGAAGCAAAAAVGLILARPSHHRTDHHTPG